MRALDSLARELADAIHARQADANSPPTAPNLVAGSLAAQTMPTASGARAGIKTSKSSIKGKESALAKAQGSDK
jgi:hypothetical protein